MTAVADPTMPINSISYSGSTDTAEVGIFNRINLPPGAPLSVTISGAFPTAYDGTFTATMNANGTFTYTPGPSVVGNASGSDMQVTFGPVTTLDNAISRVTGMENQYDGQVMAAYQYLGLSTVVQEARPQPGVDLTYIHQPNDTLVSSEGGDRYTGLDRFGRIIDQNWVNLSTGSSTGRFQYRYFAFR